MPKQTNRRFKDLVRLIHEKIEEGEQSIILAPENYLRGIVRDPTRMEEVLARIRNPNVWCCFAIAIPNIQGYFVMPEESFGVCSWFQDYSKLTEPRKLKGSPIAAENGDEIYEQRITFPFYAPLDDGMPKFEYRVCNDVFCQTTNKPDIIFVSAYGFNFRRTYQGVAPVVVNDSKEQGAIVLQEGKTLKGEEAEAAIASMGLELIISSD